MTVRVQLEDFDVGAETGRLTAGNHGIGGLCIFVGLVRDMGGPGATGEQISGMTLEHYPGMTEKQIHAIIDRASSRWSVLGAVVIHRVGDLQPGEKIVFVGIASKHRGDAFRACEYVMDSLKTEATFWKKEVTEGEARWLTTRQTDVEALDKWQVD